jgi:hypothetical protein
MRRIILAATLLWATATSAAPAPLEQALAKAGFEDAQIERTDEGVSVTCTYRAKTLDEAGLRKSLVAAMVAIAQTDAEITRATLKVGLSGHVMQVAGDPGAFRAEMDEVRFLRTARLRFLSRGPALTPGPCAAGMGCKSHPELCPCGPGSMCEPEDKTADKRGCVTVRASANAEVVGALSVCTPGHTWDSNGLDCVPIRDCGDRALGYGGECVCIPGIERDPEGGCEPKPAAPDAGPPDAAGPPAGDGVEVAGSAGGSSMVDSSFPRWVWLAMAVGVGLSLPIALFLLGSIFNNLRSRRSRIGVKKYCVHCGRKLAMEDTLCGKCNTEQP